MALGGKEEGGRHQRRGLYPTILAASKKPERIFTTITISLTIGFCFISHRKWQKTKLAVRQWTDLGKQDDRRAKRQNKRIRNDVLWFSRALNSHSPFRLRKCICGIYLKWPKPGVFVCQRKRVSEFVCLCLLDKRQPQPMARWRKKRVWFCDPTDYLDTNRRNNFTAGDVTLWSHSSWNIINIKFRNYPSSD